MDVYVINLDNQTGRLAAMQAQVPGLRRIAAIDGWKLPPQELARGLHFPDGYDLSPPEIGCTKSHRAAWTELLASGEPCACVLEDDALLSADFNRIIAQHHWLPACYDLIKIETTQQDILLDKQSDSQIEDRNLYRLRSRHLGAGGYIVSHRGAEKLLELSETYLYPVDVLMFDHRVPEFAQLRIYQMTPALCIQPPYLGQNQTDSSIEAHRARKPKRTLRYSMGRRLHDLRSLAKRPLHFSLCVPFD
ncbi:glycosyltransferase family 25 protein [Parvibaculum sedimenti]|uniref:glycosyltransferase family 25 protein n=1 Tax=Parvibaculum sedimenti TaxID=2608632 RepID=UPI001639E65D|nr:glycosyltransferase family 25 protein [Parvibaculum sedimenti]